MMKAVILLIFAAAVFGLSEKEYQDSFISFSRQFSKTYHHDEFQSRYNIYKSNLDFIHSFNAKNNGVTLAVNEYADLSNNEFNQIYKGLSVKVDPFAPVVSNATTALPTEFSWVPKGAVTAIKNQEQCGSCWSFSTTGSLEGCHQIKTGNLVGLSEQNLIDCSDAQGDEGCDGGLMTDAMNYIIANGGIDSESSYPYLAEDGTCHYSTANKAATQSSYVNGNQGDENDLQKLAAVGPVSVAIDASHNSFQFYSSGVYFEAACSTTQLDHGVLVVGWGVDAKSKEDYWIVKNSWGTNWGQDGYIWMSRNRNNNCGIATMPTLPSC